MPMACQRCVKHQKRRTRGRRGGRACFVFGRLRGGRKGKERREQKKGEGDEYALFCTSLISSHLAALVSSCHTARVSLCHLGCIGVLTLKRRKKQMMQQKKGRPGGRFSSVVQGCSTCCELAGLTKCFTHAD